MMEITITTRCGHFTCTSGPGEGLCRFMTRKRRRKYCRLYDQFLEILLFGWTQRCDQCLKEFPVDLARLEAEQKEQQERFVALAKQLKSKFNQCYGTEETS